MCFYFERWSNFVHPKFGLTFTTSVEVSSLHIPQSFILDHWLWPLSAEIGGLRWRTKGSAILNQNNFQFMCT